MRRIHGWTILLAGAGYVVASTVTAVLGGSASSPSGVKAWRLAAWLISLVVFFTHLAVERRRHQRPVSAALCVGIGVALGALGLAAPGPLRAHRGEPDRLRLVFLSIVAWPILTGVPAFVVAFVGGSLLDRIAPRRSDVPLHVA